jgi:molecular chaperone DnaK (HSP70)
VGLGIDFGTTRTVVAFCDRGNYPVVSFETEDGDHHEWFPSVVAEKDGTLCFGWDALAAHDSADQLRSFKRLLAGDARADGTVTVGSTTLPIGELVHRFFVALASALRERSNLPRALKKLERFDAVVATPANAFCTQRFLTLDAFRRAGFDVSAMLAEPSAAGFEYAHRHARTLSSKREHVVVYDLGGGTFDASLVRMSGTHHDVVATAGLAELGGDDFDRLLADLVCARNGQNLGSLSRRARARVLDACRDAKERLNASTRKITVELADGTEVVVPAADYYEACAPLVERTLTAMVPVLAAAGDSPDDGELDGVAGIYVVGGASALPIVGRVLRDRFGRRVHRSPYPHAAVAIAGAGFELDDRFSRNFGVFREGEGGRKATYDVIFTRDMPLPRAGGPELVVSRRYHAAHDVGHYRFFECADFDPTGAPRGDIAPLTDLLFAFDPGLRAAPEGKLAGAVRRLDRRGPLVEERYAVDAHGIVEITIRDLDTGYAKTQRLGAS